MVTNVLQQKTELDATPQKWDHGLLLKLDWKRLRELVRAMVCNAGYRADKSTIFADSAVDFIVARDHLSGDRQDVALVHCTSWNAVEVGVKHLKRLVVHMSAHPGIVQGIYVTPGRFSPQSRAFAEGRPIELVDGVDLLGVLNRLPKHESDYLFDLVTAGEFSTPTCPICQNKMVTHDTQIPIPWRPLKDARFRLSTKVSDDLRCETLLVDEHAEVQFSRPVYCREAVVSGGVTGDITCTGTVVVKSTGSVSGLVSARSMDVGDGALFDGQLTIIKKLSDAPALDLPKKYIWICPTESCRSGSFNTRDGWVPEC